MLNNPIITNESNTVDGINKASKELRQIHNRILSLDSSSSLNNTLLSNIESELSSINSYVSSIETEVVAMSLSLTYTNWDSTAGNSLEFIYYAGIEPGNPSGSTDNVKQIIYKKGVSTELTKEFSYNSANKVVSIIVT